MGRYGLILSENESYTNNLAIGINFDPIPANNIQHTKNNTKQAWQIKKQ